MPSFIVCVAIGAHAIAYANSEWSERFGNALIHNIHEARFAQRPLVWGKPRASGKDDREQWTVWSSNGRPVAWTLDSADPRVIGPQLRFGLIGGGELAGARILKVNSEHVSSLHLRESRPARTFAHITDAMAGRPLREFPSRATLRVRRERAKDTTDGSEPRDGLAGLATGGEGRAGGQKPLDHQGGPRHGRPAPVHVQGSQ